MGQFPGGIGYSQTSFEAHAGEHAIVPPSVPASALPGHALTCQSPPTHIAVVEPPEGQEYGQSTGPPQQPPGSGHAAPTVGWFTGQEPAHPGAAQDHVPPVHEQNSHS
jgi:hypothetical protein